MIFPRNINLLCLFLMIGLRCLSQAPEKISYVDSISSYLYNDSEKASYFLHKYIKVTKEKNDVDNLIALYSTLAISHEVMNNRDSTLFYYYKSLSLIDKPSQIIQYKYSIASIYREEYRFKEAFLLYNQIFDLAKKEKMNHVIENVKFSIKSLKNDLGHKEETLPILKAKYQAQKENDEGTLKYIRKKLIKALCDNKNYALANNLIDEGIDDALKKNNKEILFYMYKFRSKIDLDLKNHKEAIKNANLALENAIPLKNSHFINEAHYRLAEIFLQTDKPKQAEVYLNKVVSSLSTEKALDQSRYYKLLAETYSKLGDSKQSNTYFVKHIKEKDKASQKRLEALESIHDMTLKEQASDLKNSFGLELNEEIQEKEKLKKTNWAWTGISGTLLVAIIALFFFFRTKSIKNQKRFDSLMVKIKDYEERKAEENKAKLNTKIIKEAAIKEEHLELSQSIENKPITKEDKSNSKVELESTYVIDDKKVQEILNKLQNLEDKMYFLRQDCTMHNMAKKLKTNTSYLSKIINTHLDKSFSTYINELRINHAIIELKNNKRMRSYSVKGIAEEMGYKNADAFSRYFRAATGISPSVYIKKIQEI